MVGCSRDIVIPSTRVLRLKYTQVLEYVYSGEPVPGGNWNVPVSKVQQLGDLSALPVGLLGGIRKLFCRPQ